MLKLDHLAIPVSNLARSREWWATTLGLTVEFEVPDQRSVALNDSEGFAIFLREATAPIAPNDCALWFQVDGVDATYAAWSARGVMFPHPPRKEFWGYGAELVDPDGYFIRLWDTVSMREK
jgi:catechol 2,3-dioxygenase-like lactoylglutathione lyase family enzyme